MTLFTNQCFAYRALIIILVAVVFGELNYSRREAMILEREGEQIVRDVSGDKYK